MKLSEPRSIPPLNTVVLRESALDSTLSLAENAGAGFDSESPESPSTAAKIDSSLITTAFVKQSSDLKNVIGTFLTTLTVFGIFLVQGIIVARILDPLGRGEYGTALFFPRDVLLYAGLLGGIEIVNSYAVGGAINQRSLKYSAAKLGLISGTLTAICAAILSIVVLSIAGKSYLIGYCLLCCLFVPWEHMQLTISAVDRGNHNYRFYNINRLLYALAFPMMVLVAFGLRLDYWSGISPLLLMCLLSIASRIVGILPTLRGMELWSTFLRTRSSRWLALAQPSAETTVPNESLSQLPDAIAVPGPLTLLQQGKWYALSMLASELFERLDIFLIVALATVVESGHYFVAVPAAALLTVMPNALAVFTFNYGADKNRHVSLRLALSAILIVVVLQCIAASAFAVIVPYLILNLFGAGFSPAIPFALWLLPACAIKGYLQAADGYLKGRNLPMIGVKARLLSIVMMVGFVVLVYQNVIPGFEQKLLSIPMAACLGQMLSMLIITTAVILDVIERQRTVDQNAAQAELNSEVIR